MNNCLTCGGAIFPANAIVGYSGQICSCYVPPKVQRPASETFHIPIRVQQPAPPMTDSQGPRECITSMWIESKGVQYCILVDTEDYPVLSRYKWNVSANGNTHYVRTSFRTGGVQHEIKMHRLILGIPGGQIDHINRNGLDNRKSNLRFATAKENSRNRVRKNKFGYRGVYQQKDCTTFNFQIQVDGVKYHQRGFATAEDAARAYDELSKELHGEFGIRNFKT